MEYKDKKERTDKDKGIVKKVETLGEDWFRCGMDLDMACGMCGVFIPKYKQNKKSPTYG